MCSCDRGPHTRTHTHARVGIEVRLRQRHAAPSGSRSSLSPSVFLGKLLWSNYVIDFQPQDELLPLLLLLLRLLLLRLGAPVIFPGNKGPLSFPISALLPLSLSQCLMPSIVGFRFLSLYLCCFLFLFFLYLLLSFVCVAYVADYDIFGGVLMMDSRKGSYPTCPAQVSVGATVMRAALVII